MLHFPTRTLLFHILSRLSHACPVTSCHHREIKTHILSKLSIYALWFPESMIRNIPQTMSGTAVCIGLILSMNPSQAIADSAAKSGEAFVSAVERIFEQRNSASLIRLQRLAVQDPESVALQRTLGLATLWVGDFRSAIRILKRADLPAYQAMAHVHFPGGYAKAKTVLAKASARDSASARTLYLAALAFAHAKQPEKAERLLMRAVKGANTALDEAFSPDPAVGLAKFSSEYIAGLDESGEFESRIYSALHQAGRRGETYQWAEASLRKPTLRKTALRLLVLLDNATASQRALRRVQKIMKTQSASVDAAVAEVVLLTRMKKFTKARAKVDKLMEVRDASLAQALLESRLEISLHFSDDADILTDIVAESLKFASKNPKLLALVIRALIQMGQLEQAKTLAIELVKKEPLEVNPYALLVEIQEKRGKTRQLPALKARSALFEKTRTKLEKLSHTREEVLRSVRQSEKSRLAAKILSDLRKDEPQLALPLDIALIRTGTKGQASSARRRILAACASRLKTILKRRATWDQFEFQANPYGKSERLVVPLSGPDPTRCLARTLARRKSP